MTLRAAPAALALATLLGACAAAPPAAVTEPPLAVSLAPPVAVASVPPPVFESPPIEPVEPPMQQPARTAEAMPIPTSSGAEVAVAPPSLPPASPAPLPTVIVAEPTPEEREFTALLADLQRYTALGADELRRELQATTQALARTARNDAIRIRVAMLHTLARQGPQDDQRALQLLDSVAKSNPGPPAMKQLAAVLAVQVAERVRAVRDEQARSEAAIQKLEALRAMERSLLRDRVRSGGGGGGAGSGGGN